MFKVEVKRNLCWDDEVSLMLVGGRKIKPLFYLSCERFVKPHSHNMLCVGVNEV